MRFEVEVGGRRRRVEVNRVDGRYAIAVDDRRWSVDAVRVDASTLSLLLNDFTSEISDTSGPTGTFVGGVSQEVMLASVPGSGRLTARVDGVPVEVDPNSRARRGGADGAQVSGPQRLTAPMPGKVVRVLVKVGDVVTARQPVAVVEAMKMENELRAARPGRVTDVAVRDGQSVDAGAVLAIIADS